MTDPREVYRRFCAEAPPDFPVFMQHWYLDAVCGPDAWHAVAVQKGDATVAVWPFFLKKKGPWRYVAMPMLGKFMGPYLAPAYRSLDHQTRLMDQLLAQLPPDLVAFQQDFYYGITNWLPLYWQGFRQTTRYSYALSLLPDETAVWQGISRNYQRKIEKADAQLQLRIDLPIGDVYRMVMQSFERQGLAAPLPLEFCERLHAALRTRRACVTLAAVDAQGRIHSAALVAYDAESAYYLLGGDDPALRQSQSGAWLTWQAIRYAKNTLELPIFDFEGSMIRAIEMTRREFGAYQRPYFRVRRERNWWWRLPRWWRGE
jgi:hypothetical protein